MRGGTCPLSDTYSCAPEHNAFGYVNDVNGSSPHCTAHTRSSSGLAGDLATNTLARHNVIASHLRDDMHASCSPMNDAIT